MEQLLVVLSNARDGRDDEFNDWYSNVHVRDVMRLSPGAIAVQRFGLAALQFPGQPHPAHRYLAVYEADTHQGFTDGHAEVFTPTMPISDSFRFEDMREANYEPLAARVHRTDRTGASDIIIERLAENAGGADFVDWYIAKRLPAIARLAGVTEAVFSRLAAVQMLKPQPDSQYVALYRTTILVETLAAWAALDAATPVPWQAEDAVLGCYTPLIPRTTAQDIRHPTAAEAARADAARARLGGRVYPGFPAEMAGLVNS